MFQFKPGSHEDMSAVTFGGDLVDIPNQALRKTEGLEYQDHLNPNSICMVSNYKFLTDPLPEWSKNIKAICHPYAQKKAGRVFPENKRCYLLSESDFVDEMIMPKQKFSRNIKYDFSYFTYESRQGMKCKGLFILPLVMEASRRLKMRGLVIDYHPADLPKRSHEDSQLGSHGAHLKLVRSSIRKWINRGANVQIIRGRQPIEDVMKIISRSRFVLFPNTHDASPRVITECLALGVPVLVNRSIDGGWKYVNDTNGMLCNIGLHYGDILKNRKRFLRRITRSFGIMKKRKFDSDAIRADYYMKYGFFNASAALARVINDIEESMKYRFVFYRKYKEDFRINYKGQ